MWVDFKKAFDSVKKYKSDFLRVFIQIQYKFYINKSAIKSSSPKVIVTVFSSGCLQIGFGVLIIDYICNFLIWPPIWPPARAIKRGGGGKGRAIKEKITFFSNVPFFHEEKNFFLRLPLRFHRMQECEKCLLRMLVFKLIQLP